MKRLLLDQLLKWKKQSTRKPLLIDGARQVGKSYLVEVLFSHGFEKFHKINLLENSKIHSVFKESLNSDDIINSLELELNQTINLKTDLIFFDEIGECQQAVDSLKFFAEQKPEMFLCASGSNIGLLDSFPVGKVQNLELLPMSFYEFLMASENEKILSEFENQSFKTIVHEKLWQMLLDYYFVGGMPEAVKSWYSESTLIDKIEKVQQIQGDLLKGYQRDFGKYGGKVNALHIENVFNHVPLKLQETRDESVKRFKFKDVLNKKNRYSDLRGPIDWLEKTKLVHKNYVIEGKPQIPLKGLIKENIFKLFYFDIGLLCHALGLSFQDIREQDFSNKGFIAENFVLCELRILGENPSYSWTHGESEIEFIINHDQFGLCPIEVKSGKRTKAKSLATYRKKYSPKKSFKLIGNSCNPKQEDELQVWPLYYARYLGLGS